jgi:hypothetical protein
VLIGAGASKSAGANSKGPWLEVSCSRVGRILGWPRMRMINVSSDAKGETVLASDGGNG